MSHRVHEDALIPSNFKIRFNFYQFQNYVRFNFHHFCCRIGLNRAFGGFIVNEIVRVNDTSETFNKVKIIILFFDATCNNNVNRLNCVSF